VTIFRVCGNGDYGVCYVSQHEEISTRAPCFCVAYQVPHAVARDGTHVVAAEAPHAVAADGTREVTADGTHAVTADGTHAVTADGTHAVTADGTHVVAAEAPHAVTGDRRARTCAAAPARRARRRGPGPPRTAPRVPHAGGEKKLQNFNASSRDSPALS
jgi:hypothetical protein